MWNAQGMGRWLQDYSSALAAGASIVLVFITSFYVRLTAKLSKDERNQVMEMRKTRLDSQMPVVAITVDAKSEGENYLVIIDVEALNIGQSNPADIAVLFDPDWKSTNVGAVESESGGVYFTVNPGGRGDCRLVAELVERSVIAESDKSRIEQLIVEFEISALAAGVSDWYTWTGFFDHETRCLRESRKTAIHERRDYSKMDLGDLHDKKTRSHWWSHTRK